MWVPVPQPLIAPTSSAARLDVLLGRQRLAHVDQDSRLALLERDDVLEVALVGLKAGEDEARGGGDLARQRQGRLSGLHAAAAHPDVDLDEDAQRHSGRDGRVRQLAHVAGVVDGDRQRAAPGERDQAGDLERPHDLVGDEDVLDAAVSERLRLAELGAGDADGAGGELQLGDLDALVRLGVRAQLRRPARREVGHAADVALELGLVEHERRGVDLGGAGQAESAAGRRAVEWVADIVMACTSSE